MNKYPRLILAAAFGAVLATAASAADGKLTYFECDFNKGIPATFRTFDRDGQTLHFTMTQLGFSTTDSWIALRDEATEADYYAAGASRHKSVAGQSPVAADDWLVTPEIWIRGGGATLSWRGSSVNDAKRTGSSYAVYVSDRGQTPDDFAGCDPVAVVDEESVNAWTPRTADLSAFEGKRVYIAFVNTSLDKEVLGIDDIRVEGASGIADIAVTPDQYALGSRDVKISCRITATSETPVTTVELVCRSESGTMSRTENLMLKKGESADLEFDGSLTADYGQTLDFTIEARINGVDFEPIVKHAVVMSFLPEKRIVVEESTGMWCGYCPQGIVALDILKKNYGSKAILIAVHTNDKLQAEAYHEGISFSAGSPTAWIDRKTYRRDLMTDIREGADVEMSTLWGGIETYFIQRLRDIPMAAIEAVVDYEPGSQMTVSGSTCFPVNVSDADYRVAFVATEDNLWEDGYYQTNYYAGVPYAMGGFESRPDKIRENFAFNHVARELGDAWKGVKVGIPAEIEAGVEYPFSVDFPVDGVLTAPSKARVVAMVIDNATGAVMNATEVAVDPTSVGGLQASADVDVNAIAGEGIVVTAADADAALEVAVYDVAGRLVATASGRGAARAALTAGGIYIVRVAAGCAVTSQRVAL